MTPEPTTTSPAPDAPRGALATVFLVVFIDLLGFGIVLPVAPLYAKKFVDPAGFDDLTRGAVIGVLYASFSLMQFVFGPVWGRLSDRVGRKPVLLVGLSASVIFYAMFGFVANLPSEMWPLALGLLLLGRTGQGIAGATIATAQAVIADVTPPEKRAKTMGLIGLAFGLGFTLGPMIALGSVLLAEWLDPASGALGVEGYVAAAMSALALLFAIRRMPETLRPHTGPVRHGGLFDLSRTGEVLRAPVVGPLILLFALVVFAFANFEGTLSLLADVAFGLSRRWVLVLFTFIGAVLVCAQLTYRRSVVRLGEVWFLRSGVALMLVGLAVVGLSAYLAAGQTSDALRGPLVVLLAGLVVQTVGFAFVNPSVSSLISKSADPARQGEILGVNQSCAALSRIAGPFLGAAVFYLGDAHVWPYVQAVAILSLALLVLPKAEVGGGR